MSFMEFFRALFEGPQAALYSKSLVQAYNEIASEVDAELARLALLLLSTLRLDDTSENRNRAWILASRFADRIELVEFLAFLHTHRLRDDFQKSFLADRLFPLCEEFYDAISPVYIYGLKIVRGIWDDPRNVSKHQLENAAIALYFCTIIAPNVTGPWVNLAILHAYQIGAGPYRYTRITDSRDHVAVGVRAVEDFLNKHKQVIDAETKLASELGLSELIKIDDKFRSLAAQALEKGVVSIR
jgi:hypothetical protein